MDGRVGVRRAVQAGRGTRQALALKAAERIRRRGGSATAKPSDGTARQLIHQNARVLTHCNAGWLAFVDVGSATAPLYAARQPAANSTFLRRKVLTAAQARPLTA